MIRRETFMGYEFVVHPELDDAPRMQLSHSLAKLMPPEFVERYNDWLLQFFGTETHIYAIDNGSMVALGPKTFAKIKASNNA